MTKKVTLTFDNGPDAQVTPFVLDELRDRSIAAWFCVVGASLIDGDSAALTRRAIADGHKIANHTKTHSIALGDNPSLVHAEQEIADMHHIMIESLGDWGDHWYRPYGRKGQLGPHIFSEASLSVLENFEYSVLLWNSVPGDWKNPSGWLDNALGDVDENDHTVVVLHDIPGAAKAQLSSYLDELSGAKVEFTLDLPESVVPIRKGKPVLSLDGLLSK